MVMRGIPESKLFQVKDVVPLRVRDDVWLVCPQRGNPP